VIAAPGSGKTVLGLEVVRRMNEPTLIFAPTIAIRDQWIDRFIHLFSSSNQVSYDWITNNIKEPKFLTVSTYQGLHSACTGEQETEFDEEEDSENYKHTGVKERVINRDVLFDRLKELKIKTIVVDEAHHLRSEWWKCLIALKKHLDDPTIVALTATPPYDVPPMEWERYEELCGPVDSEISVPELVLEKNLCPHQDYIYISTPLKDEQTEINEFRERIEKILYEICINQIFVELVLAHPCIKKPHENIEEILSDPAFYSSIAIFLNHVKKRVPRHLLKIIGVSNKKCPRLDYEWMEIFLTGCLYSHRDSFADSDVLDEILRNLSRAGATERRKVKLINTDKISRLLVSSISKLNSICEIVKIESGALSDTLRMVILTDFIRKADLPQNNTDLKPLKKIGVVPIFETIRRCNIDNIKLGILSGSLVVIPRRSREMLDKIACGMLIDVSTLRYSPLKHDNDFYNVEISGVDRQKIVKLITSLLEKGGITVLVGTKSLLGEGWDAPSINSLILASFVGSYMLSNQMRGRAIRTQTGNPDKTANVWHLVCVETGRKDPSQDMVMLSRRFKSFVGVSFIENVIENGIARVNIGNPPFAQEEVSATNAAMKQGALDRVGLRRRWWEVLQSDENARMTEEVACSSFSLPRNFVFTNTIMALIWQGLLWAHVAILFILSGADQGLARSDYSARAYMRLLALVLIVGAVVLLPKCLKAFYLFLKHGPISSSMKQIGKALLRALVNADLIDTRLSKMGIKVRREKYGTVSCSLAGATTYEKSLFLDAMQEILGPVENPRYLLIRKTPLGRMIRKDYHVVPQVLGRKKELAEYFMKMWAKYIGPTELVYTRSIEGRQILLKARGAAMSSGFLKRAERIKSWK
jgi:superfamily II DNA or RNA helicase